MNLRSTFNLAAASPLRPSSSAWAAALASCNSTSMARAYATRARKGVRSSSPTSYLGGGLPYLTRKLELEAQRELEPFDPFSIALNKIADNPGAHKKARKVGRGTGSSKGKQCGRGTKGQKARGRGKVSPGFEGGQTPLYKRVRKHGFTNAMFRSEFVGINLGQLQQWIDAGRLSPEGKITMATLQQSGLSSKLTKSYEKGIKLLAGGSEFFAAKLDLEVSKVSQAAREAIEKNGGSVQEVYYHPRQLRMALRHPENPLPPPQEYRTRP
ncbi:ribosomal protein L15, putative [Acanthamoeba castellanii str. Neff]|uniref:Ribosomal protein L15, putative n=1 Tax=Acanthamoeba castellanii (strain ATCC 30010 / Neff) TaxID=1257118 RepID=L8GW37_ACACF|nr:ribosomal protein L15, putative [Acanthamoeba castellanii str. Neff]ELR17220.1 ribosomal protein L15, putative [Acanthamoeba castellanii str. Neff]